MATPDPDAKEIGKWIGAGGVVLAFCAGLWKLIKSVMASDLKAMDRRIDGVEAIIATQRNERTQEMAAVNAQLSQLTGVVHKLAGINEGQTRQLDIIEDYIIHGRRK